MVKTCECKRCSPRHGNLTPAGCQKVGSNASFHRNHRNFSTFKVTQEATRWKALFPSPNMPRLHPGGWNLFNLRKHNLRWLKRRSRYFSQWIPALTALCNELQPVDFWAVPPCVMSCPDILLTTRNASNYGSKTPSKCHFPRALKFCNPRHLHHSAAPLQ